MWTWVWSLRKCFGASREQSPAPEDFEAADCSSAGTEQLQHSVEELPATELWQAGQRQETGTPEQQKAASPSIIDAAPSTPQLHKTSAVPAMRASPLLRSEQPAASRVSTPANAQGSPPKLARQPQQAIRNPSQTKTGQGSYSAQHLNAQRIAKVTKSPPAKQMPTAKVTKSPPAKQVPAPGQSARRSPQSHASRRSPQSGGKTGSAGSPAAKRKSPAASGNPPAAVATASGSVARKTAGAGPRPSRLSVSTPAQQHHKQSFGNEDQPLKAHNTPFDVRLERQLQSSQASQTAPESASSLDAAPTRSTPAAVQLDDATTSNFSLPHPGSPKRKAEALSLPGTDPNQDTGGKGKDASSNPPSPQRSGKENAADGADSKPGAPPPRSALAATSREGLTPLPGVLKPKLQVAVPDASTLSGTPLPTPSPSQIPRFVMDTNSSWGTPQVVGVENLNTQFREDKRLRVHETPFELRVERFIESERAWKEKHAKPSSSDGRLTG